MALSFQQLTKDIDKVNIEDICSAWQWCLTDQKAVILVSAVGDMFLLDKNDTINWLDTGYGQLTKVADDLTSFEQMLLDNNYISNWLLAEHVEELIKKGKTLQQNQVYSFKKLPALGGDYSIDNFEPTDISIHFSMTGQVHEQIKDLPSGTKINNIKFEP